MHLSSSHLADLHQAYGSSRDSDPAAESSGTDSLPGPMFQKFGDSMTATQVAAELGYSPVYFTKKIGSEKHAHLDWVKALRPARVKAGATFVYKTKAVEVLMRGRGLI